MAGLFWKRATKEGAVIGTICGFITLFVMTYSFPNLLEVTPFLWAILVNTLLLIIISLATPEPPKEVIEKFFDPELDDFKETASIKA